jgi:mono/diheme cytochrome c family protein
MKHCAITREGGRKTPLWMLLFLLAAGSQSASAQQAGAALNDTQRHGQQLLAQSCGICHLPPELGARTYGPQLNKAAGGGDDDIMREYILNGTPRMPSFKAYLKPADIDAIISYVRTVPVPAAAPAAR